VAPHLFRRGLGTLLVRKIQEDGHGPIAVDVSENNVEAMAFFNHLKFGHRRGDVRRHFFDDDQDAFHFVWKRTGR
jgi:ribosomal protein S18 acetylase RimI-like enzyme